MEPQVNKPLIRKYLIGECSESELQVMSRFLEREDAEQFIDQVWAEEWENFQEAEISDQEIVHWRNRFFQEKLGDNSTSINKPTKRFFTLRIAAVWLTIMFGLGAWYGSTHLKRTETKTLAVTMLEHVNSNGQRVQITLADSSIVYLAGGSKLRYPTHFSGNTREISLQGEAFFEITKNKKKPFIIHTGDINTVVVGTSFRINAFKSKPFLIEVATGKVQIARQDGNKQAQLAVLTPGQSMSWINNQAIVGQVHADDVSEWKNGRLVFNGASLKEMASVFERWYDAKIIFNNDQISSRHISITLTANVPLSEIMEVLARTAKFQYSIKGKEVIIN